MQRIEGVHARGGSAGVHAASCRMPPRRRSRAGRTAALGALAVVAALALAEERVADYPWTNDIRPTIVCFPHTVMQACKAAGGVDIRTSTDLEPFDPSRRLDFGEEYDPAAWEASRIGRLEQNMTGDHHRLRRIELPVHFPYPDVPLPDLPPAVSDGGYREGMTSREYWEHLCANEAGKFIYERVEGVEGIFQMRPRVFASDSELKDRYVMPAPYGYTIGETDNGQAMSFVRPSRYSFLETTLYEAERFHGIEKYYHPSMVAEPTPDARYIRYTGNADISTKFDVFKHYTTTLRSEYGYFWRDIRRRMDRELGIGGGEIIVVELKTNKVLAIWRGFLWAGNERRVWWLGGAPCPNRTLDTKDNVEFLMEVLKPKEYVFEAFDGDATTKEARQ